MKQPQTHQKHPFPPLYDQRSRALILGSFPSVKSREAMFFYGHPQNRFWKVMTALLHEESPVRRLIAQEKPIGKLSDKQRAALDAVVPQTVDEKRALMKRRHIALWDTIASCDITGSSDASIANVVANDLTPLLQGSDIRQIFCNGKTSHDYYEKYSRARTGLPAAALPSTSPANAAWTLEKLIDAWRVILPAIDDLP